MLIPSIKQTIKYALLFFSFLFIFLNQPSNFVCAEVKNLIGDFDYSSLSEQEIKEEVGLLYKYAKKSFLEDDYETSKLLFYQILELQPSHSGANRYIDFKIPREIGKIKHLKSKEEQVYLDKKKESEFQKREKYIQNVREQLELIEQERVNRQTIHKDKLVQLEEEATIRKKLEIEKRKRLEVEKESQKAVLVDEESKKEKEEAVEKGRIDKITEDDKAGLVKREIVEEDQKVSTEKEQEIDKQKREKIQKIMEQELFKIEKDLKLLAQDEKGRELIGISEKEDEERKLKEQEGLKKREIMRLLDLEKKTRGVEEKQTGVKDMYILSDKQLLEKKREEFTKQKTKKASIKDSMLKLNKEKVKDKKSKIKETSLIKENIREKKKLAIVEKYQGKTKAALKKSKKAYIKALYREGLYCYKIGKYELAKEAFSKVLELDPTQLKAADYLHIYIPEAEKDVVIRGR